MVKYQPLTRHDAEMLIEDAGSIIDRYGGGRESWAAFNSATKGMTRDDKSAIFRYAWILRHGKTNARGEYIVRPGDERGARNYIKTIIGKKIVHDMNGPKRARKLMNREVGGIVSGRSAEVKYREDARNMMMERMGDYYRGTRKPTPKKKKSKKRRETEGSGYDGGFMFLPRPIKATRQLVDRVRQSRGSGLAGGFFDDGDVEYVGMGFDEEEYDDNSYDSSDECYSDDD